MDAHAGLADGYRRLGINGFAPPRETMPKAKKAARRALEIDPNHVDSHVALGWVLGMYEWDWEGAEQIWRRAGELAPGNAEVRYGYGQYLFARNRPEEALAAAQRAVALDPASVGPRNGLCNALFLAGRYEEAKQAARKLIEIHPDSPFGYLQLGLAQIGTSEFQEAANAFEKGAPLMMGSAYLEGLLAQAYVRLGREKQAREILSRLIERRQEHYVSALAISYPLLTLGETEEAWSWIDTAFEERDGWMGYANLWPADGLMDASDPRYQDLLRKLNLD